jgi:surface protein
MSEPFSTEPQENDKDEIKLHSSKKGLIIVSISILLILIAIGVILYFIFSSGSDSKEGGQNDEGGDIKNLTNYILAKYEIYDTEKEMILFYKSYIDSIESLKIDGKEENINNTKLFNTKGAHTIEIIFKNKLTSLESFFYYAESLIEVDLSKLNFIGIETLSEMFLGCTNLTKINFENFDSSKVYNISNMFKGCSNLKEIDLNLFKNNDNLIDIEGLFSGCSSLSKIDLKNLNTIYVINMSNLFYDCTSLQSLNIDNLKTENVFDM